jgi:hypothetical protein
MSEQQINERFPLSESFVITIVGALLGCVSGVLACVLKSRCSTIKCCGIECQRVPIPITELDKVEVDLTPVNLRPRLNNQNK